MTLNKERERETTKQREEERYFGSREMRERETWGYLCRCCLVFGVSFFFSWIYCFFIFIFYILCGHHYVRSVIIHFNYICKYVDFPFFFLILIKTEVLFCIVNTSFESIIFCGGWVSMLIIKTCFFCR